MQADVRAFLSQHGNEYRTETSLMYFSIWYIPGGGCDYDKATPIASFTDDVEKTRAIVEEYSMVPEMAFCAPLKQDNVLRLDYKQLAGFIADHRATHPDDDVHVVPYAQDTNLGKDFVEYFHLQGCELPWVKNFIETQRTNTVALMNIREYTIGTNSPEDINIAMQ